MIDDFLFKAEKKQNLDVRQTLRDYASRLRRTKDPLLTADCDSDLNALEAELDKAASGAGKDGLDTVYPVRRRLRRVFLSAARKKHQQQNHEGRT